MKESGNKKEKANGEVCHSIDDKGRLSIPNRFRELLSDSFVMTRGLDHCLWMMTKERWNRMEAGIRKLDHNKREVRAYARFLMGGMCEVELDKQGRMVLPQSLRDYARLEKEVLFSRGVDYVEVWPKDNYYEEIEGIDMADCAENISLILPPEEEE
ncbi:MAG: division/cell wall cluster transcriptional repressor MraZ [Lachnospiraceae bacterium]|nr:division/cell wall cluster transcriptional repressor MraZ [Lachnospiraceae bacterium]